MSNAAKRMDYANHPVFQDRVGYWFWAKASEVFVQEMPDAVDLAFAKAIYAGSVSKQHMCLAVITNTAIGASLDLSQEPPDGDIEWAVKTDNQYGKLAQAYHAAGLLGG